MLIHYKLILITGISETNSSPLKQFMNVDTVQHIAFSFS